MTKVIAVTSQKGGVGKTTTAVNLAAAFAREGQRVLLIEVDPQGAILPSLGLSENVDAPSLGQVLDDDLDIADAIVSTPFEGIDVVSACATETGEELSMDRMAAAHPLLLRDKINRLMGRYDTIFLDGPPTLGALSHLTLAAADSYVVPVQAEEYAYRTLERFFTTAEQIERDYNPELQCAGLLITMVDLRTRMSVRVVNQLHENYGDRVLMSMIPRTVSLQDMPVRGEPTLVHAPSSRGGKAYTDAARELLHQSTAVDPVHEVEEQSTSRLLEAARSARAGESAVSASDLGDDFPRETLISAFPSTEAPRRAQLDENAHHDTYDSGEEFFGGWDDGDSTVN